MRSYSSWYFFRVTVADDAAKSCNTQLIEVTLASRQPAAARLQVTGQRVTTSDLSPICPARNRIFGAVRRQREALLTKPHRRQIGKRQPANNAIDKRHRACLSRWDTVCLPLNPGLKPLGVWTWNRPSKKRKQK